MTTSKRLFTTQLILVLIGFVIIFQMPQEGEASLLAFGLAIVFQLVGSICESIEKHGEKK